MINRRRPIPHNFLAFLLGHQAGAQQRTRGPASFYPQCVARTPSLEVRETLSTVFARADSLLLEGTEIAAARLHEAAIARALIATHQLSVRDLMLLDISHLERNQGDRIRRLRMAAQEVASPLGVDIPLPEHLAVRLVPHLLTFRPLLPGAEHSTRLFLGSDKSELAIQEFRARLRLVELMSHPTTIRG
jgi:hypothetical protein